MSQWYYAHDGQQKGPVPISELQRLAANGDFDPEKDLVWQEGLPDWKPAATVPELSSLNPQSQETNPSVPEPGSPAPAAATPASAPYQTPQASPAPAPAYTSTTNVPPNSGLAMASIICGIVGFLTCFLWCASIPLGIAAVVTGHLAMSKIKRDPAGYTGKGLARIGTIAGYLAIVLSLVFVAIANYLVSLSPERMEELGFPPEAIEQLQSQKQLREEIQRQHSE